MLNKIQDRFTESIQTQISASELLPAKLSEAANRIVACLLRGDKVIVCGHGRSYGNAELLVSHLLHRYELARPSFAAVQLQLSGVLAGVVAQDNELEAVYKKQLQAVAKRVISSLFFRLWVMKNVYCKLFIRRKINI